MRKYTIEYTAQNYKQIRTALGIRSARAEALSLVYSRHGHVKILDGTGRLVQEFEV